MDDIHDIDITRDECLNDFFRMLFCIWCTSFRREKDGDIFFVWVVVLYDRSYCFLDDIVWLGVDRDDDDMF